MGLFSRKSKRDTSVKSTTLYAYYISSDGSLPLGYHRLLDSPEVGSCINRISAIISSATIYLMQNTPSGDKRLKNALSRFVDVEPWPNMATRQVWMSWIVAQLLGEGDGNACVLPIFRGGRIAALRPMPGANLAGDTDGLSYTVNWRGQIYRPDEVLHFRLHADPDDPWRGRGYRVQAQNVAASLKQVSETKDKLNSPEYKPPMIISVDSDADLQDAEKRKEFRKNYIETPEEAGEPWILPEGLVKVDQLHPLTLADLAIKDTVELDKKTVAGIFGIPLFMLGLGKFDQTEFNNFIRTVVEPICVGIEQELTLKLLISSEMYFTFNRRRLYSYDLKSMIDLDLAMSDRGFMNGDEVREDAYRNPAGLKEFRVLENYIPDDMLGKQKKLIQEDDEDAEKDDSDEDAE